MTRHIRKTRGPTAICQVCGARRALNLDGGIRMHADMERKGGNWAEKTCPGSGHHPVKGTIEAP